MIFIFYKFVRFYFKRKIHNFGLDANLAIEN